MQESSGGNSETLEWQKNFVSGGSGPKSFFITLSYILYMEGLIFGILRYLHIRQKSDASQLANSLG